MFSIARAYSLANTATDQIQLVHKMKSKRKLIGSKSISGSGRSTGRSLTRFRPTRKILRVPKASNAEAEAEAEAEVYYEGLYGKWKVDGRDKLEVYGYRAAISVMAAAALFSALSNAVGLDRGVQDASYFAAASGLGVALALVHIYVSEIKLAMQAMYVVGLIGSVGIAVTNTDVSVLSFVEEHRATVWLIGPMFAAFTGLAFKEGACYGKPEAFSLFLITPLMCLGHLTGLASREVELFFCASFLLAVSIFALRKYTQAIKDDIGDKSVFTFRALKTDVERKAYLESQGKDLSLLVEDGA